MLSRRYALALFAEIGAALFAAACSSSSAGGEQGGGELNCGPGYAPNTSYYQGHYSSFCAYTGDQYGYLPPGNVPVSAPRRLFGRYDGSRGGGVTMRELEALTNRRRG